MLKNKIINSNKDTILRIVLSVFCVFFVFMLVALTIIYITAQKRYSSKFYEEELERAIHSKYMQINDYFKEDLAFLRVMSNSPVIIDFLTNPENSEKQECFWDEIDSYRSLMSENRNLFFVSKVNKKFYFDTSYAYIVDNEMPDFYWFDSTLNKTTYYNFNLDYDSGIGDTLLWINFPVFNNSEAIGILGVGINIDGFAEALKKGTDLVKDFKIFNESYEILLHENHDLIKNKKDIRSVLPESVVDELVKLSKEEKSRFLYKGNTAYDIIKLPFMQSYLIASTEVNFMVGFGYLYFIIMVTILSLCLVLLVCLYKFIKATITPLQYFNNLTQTILKHVPMNIAVFDNNGQITLISQQMDNLLHKEGVREKGMLGVYLDELRKKDGFFEATREFEMDSGKSSYYKIIKMNIEQVGNNDKQSAILYIVDVTEHMFLANTDSLTGIANRRYFGERADIEIFNSIRDKKPLAFLMLDIDHFKKYNDTYGHSAGDDMLKKTAEILTGIVERRADLVGRVGGEEFAIMLCNTDLNHAKIVAERIRLAVEEQNSNTISIGVYSTVPQQDEDYKMLLNQADKKLYEAKNSGRNRVCA